MVPGVLTLLPEHLLFAISILLWVQLGREAADVVGERVGGGLVHRGGPCLTCYTCCLRLYELALDYERPRWRICMPSNLLALRTVYCVL